MIGALVQGGATALFMILGVLHSRVPGIPLIHRGSVLNVANGALLYLVRISVVVWASTQLEIGLISIESIPGMSSAWAQLVLCFVLLDFTRYWVHRLDHRVPALWRFHRVHHCAERLDATSGLRMHIVDFFQLSAIPIVLFGVLLDTSASPEWVLAAALAVGAVFDPLQHANIAMDMSKPWNRAWNLLLNNPHFHSWHHTRDGELCDGNYGNTLLIWDRLFGSEVTRSQPPVLYGISADQALEESVLGWQLLRPRATAGEPRSSGEPN